MQGKTEIKGVQSIPTSALSAFRPVHPPVKKAIRGFSDGNYGEVPHLFFNANDRCVPRQRPSVTGMINEAVGPHMIF